ncbi:MAG: 1,4-alpha-glucan branching protein GlgB, partial [Simkaniaceae bacterium]|nr:1,4-alpha-glucan branching protein GlgB [Simkaniaceae bacterium]
SALWTNEKWIEQRKNRNHNCLPMNIYEVHLGSWRRRDGQFMNYRDIAVELAQYCKEMHYTHIEMMPITEHPLDESWGYQVTGYFAATSRFGSVQDFQFFMNHMHQEGLFVILDWVGGHFPTDVFALAQFDGSCLYEYSDPQKGFHPHWNTLIFDYGKPQVANFLLASVAYWAEVMHLDGFRLDAVSSMIYLSFGRDPGQWRPNQYGGPENLEAVAFLRQLNTLVHEKFPGVITIAEESSAYPLVSFPISQGGLGFDFKSNLGWMNDTLKYFSTDFPYRAHRHDLITFYLMYAFSEHFALFLSHDEVVHEKRSLIGKMPGNQAQQFANARLLYTMMMTLPGKKLIFMGGEFAQWNEWYEKEEIHWFLLAYPTHQGMQRCVKAINKLYLDVPSFWESDHMPHGFQWIACDDRGGGVISYLRKGGGLEHLVIHNFSQNQYPEYTIHIHTLSSIKEVFNSESELFMGCGLINSNLTVDQGRVNFSLAPFVTAIFEVKFG